jgi:hypothetical protein
VISKRSKGILKVMKTLCFLNHKGAQRVFTKAREGIMNEKNCGKIPPAPKAVENPVGGLTNATETRF